MKHWRKPLLILLLPALLLAMPPFWLAALLPASIRADGISGTLWAGRVAGLGVNGQLLLSNLHWQWLPQRLLAGQLAVAVDAAEMQGMVVYGRGGVQVENLNAALPLSPLMHGLPANLQPSGRLLINTPLWQPDQQLDLDVRGLSVVLSGQPQLLGSASVSLLWPQWQVRPLPGSPLAISGQGQQDHGQLTLTANDDATQAMVKTLGGSQGTLHWSF